MDTASDFRIALAEKGISEALKLVQNLKVQRRKEIAKEIERMSSEIQNVKYCYLSAEEILEFDSFKMLVDTASKLYDVVEKAEFDYSREVVRYWLDYIRNLPLLMARGEINRAFEAVRYFAGEITTRKEIDGLWLCVLDCGFRMEVVTNNDEFRAKKFAVVCHLPPRRFGSYISYGMFVELTGEKKGELELEEIRSLRNLGEVEAMVISLISK